MTSRCSPDPKAGVTISADGFEQPRTRARQHPTGRLRLARQARAPRSMHPPGNAEPAPRCAQTPAEPEAVRAGGSRTPSRPRLAQGLRRALTGAVRAEEPAQAVPRAAPRAGGPAPWDRGEGNRCCSFPNGSGEPENRSVALPLARHPRPASGTPMAESRWMEEEGSLFKGLPPLPKALRTPPTHGPLAAGERQQALDARGTSSQRDSALGSSLQARLLWVRKELLSLQETDLALLRQLDSSAQEIQDLRDLQLEMEEFFGEGEPLGPATSSHWHLCPLKLSGGMEGKAL
ncbi:proline-rich protein 2-like [Malaclemys terrapin pileata]|uniref:proline-rich protein 2-like n=1 Tax=Malaclemys terrapin pileata TaxID=2991368 RepID=UPI0023A8564C|nr:proline-rich protein 2-like [Malaclemys terrapin pileata]